MLPFGVWGLMMIVINTVAHSQLANVGSPVALFNLVSHRMLKAAWYQSGTVTWPW